MVEASCDCLELSRLGVTICALLVCASFAGPAIAATVATTTVTTYSYDADGAPTAITMQVDGGDSSTVYLTWQNFVPDPDDPTTGSVSAADGNLAGGDGRVDRVDARASSRSRSLGAPVSGCGIGTCAVPISQ